MRDERFILALQKKFSAELGFLPTCAIREYISREGIYLTEENGDHAGYILMRSSLAKKTTIASIIQAAICMDAQRRRHGLALVADAKARAARQGATAIQCWCADDISGCEFWPAAGFLPIARRSPKNQRRRKLTLWRATTRGGILTPEMRVVPTRAGYRACTIEAMEILKHGLPDPQSLLFQ